MPRSNLAHSDPYPSTYLTYLPTSSLFVMSSTLDVLPQELLSQVISSVEKSGWLLDLALCCRSLYGLTLPHLYSSVRLIYHDFDEPYPHLEPFTIKVLKNPGLASFVREFALTETWRTDDYPRKLSGSNEVNEILQENVRRSSHSEDEESMWFEALTHYPNEDALLALLLPSLPNLNRLDLMVPASGAEYYEKMFRRAVAKEKPFDVQPAFSSLRVIVNNCDDTRYGTSPDLMSNYLQLPSLQEFYGQNVYSEEGLPHTSLTRLETASVLLTRLEIRRSRFNEDDLMNMFRSFKNLTTFVYNLGWVHISHCNYSASALRKALAWVEHSLENLWIDSECEKFFWTEDDLTPISSLASFKILKNIRLGMYIFSAESDSSNGVKGDTEADAADGDASNLANLLPRSLETIYFSHTNSRLRVLTKALENWLQQKESSTPELKRIAFEAYNTANKEKFDFSQLDLLAKQAGVTVDKFDDSASIDYGNSRWKYDIAKGNAVAVFKNAGNL